MILTWLDRARRRLPNEAMPLVLLRGLVILASGIWLVFAPPDLERPGLVAVVLAVFAAYSVGLCLPLWFRANLVLRWNLPVLAIDLAFALAIIRVTGGARSVFFLALCLITALQAYYYGLRRGLGVAVGAALLYLAVIWPTLDATQWADYALRNGMLVLTAIGLGAISKLEGEERREIVALNEALSSRERFVRDVVASLRDGVVVMDRERRIMGWNPAMEARYGVSATEVLGRPFADVFRSLARGDLGAAVERVYAAGDDGFVLERVRHETLHAGQVVFNFRASAVRGGDGRRHGLILFVEDVSERVALEESLRQSERLAGLGTLAAGLAHEINNPVGVITSRSELMIEDAERQRLPTEARDDLEVIRIHAHRVARITQGLLSFARHRPGEKVRVDVNRMVEDTVLLVAKQVQSEGIVLRVDLAPELPPVQGDPTLLGQVLLNLLNNARDAVLDDGEITIRTEPDPSRAGGVRLVVRDTGIGIAEDQIGRIFEPFYTTKPNGTGLGLAICYGIVREHDGFIGVESQPGQGTTFVLCLPGAESRTAPTPPQAEA